MLLGCFGMRDIPALLNETTGENACFGHRLAFVLDADKESLQKPSLPRRRWPSKSPVGNELRHKEFLLNKLQMVKKVLEIFMCIQIY